MNGFEKKQLNQTKRVCLRLKEAREKAGLTLADLSKQTKICKKHLRALEECRFDDIPYASIYQKNFVKRYAQAISLSAEDLGQQFIEEEINKKEEKKKNPYKKVKKEGFGNLPTIFRILGSSVAVCILVAYIGWQIRALVKPPVLMVFYPEEGFVTEEQELQVHGKTEKEAQIYVNGEEITNNRDGQFIEDINLSLGINTVTISARKKHGKTSTIIRHVTLKPDQQFSYNN